MKTVSMKRAKDEKKEDGCEPCSVTSHEDYPWGLRITLDDEQLKSLGMSALPAVGMPVGIEAIGLIVSASENSVDDGKSERRVEIQITDLAIAASGPALQDRMYPKK